MLSKATRDELMRLTVAERIQLAQDLWDSVTDDPDTLVLTDAQRVLLDERLAALDAEPDAGTAWDVVCEQVRQY